MQGASVLQRLDTGAMCRILSVVAISDAATGGTEECIIALSPMILVNECPAQKNEEKLGRYGGVFEMCLGAVTLP